MRKGRSSRRSRNPRPLVGVKVPRSAEALSTEIDPASPRVVLGLPPSDAPSGPPDAIDSDAPSPSLQADAAAAPDFIIPKLPPPPVDPLEALEALETGGPAVPLEPLTSLEKTSVPAAPLDLTSLPAAPLHLPNAPAAARALPVAPSEVPVASTSLASTLAFGSISPSIEGSSVDTQRSFAPEPLSLPKPASVDESANAEAPPAPAPNGDTSEPARAAPSQDRPTSDSPKPVEETRVAKVEEAPVVASIDPDEISVPPIGDVAVEGFFSERDLAGRLEAETDDDDALAATDKAKRKADPKVVQRRARFVRYVTWAVAGAAVVCLAAVGRTAVSAVSSTSSVASKQAIVGEAATAAPKAAVPAVAPIAQPSVAPSPSTVATAAESAAPTEAASAAPETASDEIVGDASEEKAKARSLLEKRKIAEAIEAGERSVKLDASDGEAWLILGAAYQEKGNIVEARRAYASCVKEGKTGPRQECAKMLR